MRKAIIKEVRELNERELELLLNDKILRDEIMRYVNDMESCYIDDILDYIKPYLSEYSIIPYNYSYMKVSNMVGFIYGLEKLNREYGVFYDDDMLHRLELAIEACGIHEWADVGSDIYYDTMDSIELYTDELNGYLTGELVRILEYYDSFEIVERESDYINHYLEVMYDSECLVDGDKVTLI